MYCLGRQGRLPPDLHCGKDVSIVNSVRLYREPEEHKRISLCETCLNVTATMAAITQIILCIFFLTQSKIVHGTESEINAKEEKSEELLESESKDGKLEIIKRIKKINDDGSYTIGYEADDGSFKIESRDVLGQIKGTYGFVDEEGQIKRVSYSTSNSSEIITKPDSPSVVQRIPNKNKTTPTRIPITTQSTPTTTSNSVVQSIARRRATTTTSTTQKPNYSEVINVAARTTSRPSTITYTSTPPRVLIQNRLPVTSTVATQTHTAKSEGQLIRPEVVTLRPTEMPLFRRLALKQLDKPVTEEPEPEARGNILRRQLSQENTREYNLQEHLYSLQQSLGHDATDVYSASMTTGTPRPLFTTTSRPRIISLPSPTPSVAENAPRPTIRYPLNYQRNVLQDLERNSPEYAQETTTTDQPVTVPSTQTSVPVIQLPPNGAESQEPLVAIRHPFQKGTILVPLSQLQGRLIPVENSRDLPERQKQYTSQQEQFYRETTTRPNVVEIEQQQAVVRRLPPPPLRPIPVQVDENGYIRELPQHVQPSYPVPIPIQVMPAPKYSNNEIDGEIDNIEPPVSTRDFQKLLQQLIVRQSRLEKISALTRQNDIYLQDQQQQQQQRYRAVYPQSPEPYYVRRESAQANGPVQFIQRSPEGDSQQRLTPREFFEMSDERHRKQTAVRPQSVFENQYDQSYRPNRRVARLLPRAQQRQQEAQDEYLPPDVREMLLLRMLQLAINPALPLDDDKFDLPAAATQVKRMPVRNVEILGEEEPDEPPRRSEKVKRFRESETNYE